MLHLPAGTAPAKSPAVFGRLRLSAPVVTVPKRKGIFFFMFSIDIDTDIDTDTWVTFLVNQ